MGDFPFRLGMTSRHTRTIQRAKPQTVYSLSEAIVVLLTITLRDN
jgi:hypothetical protein